MDNSPWEHADLNVQLMKYVSVGPGGIFASAAKDESVWCRFNLSGGKPTTKVSMDKKGDGWNKIANVSILLMTKQLDTSFQSHYSGLFSSLKCCLLSMFHRVGQFPKVSCTYLIYHELLNLP